MTKVWCNFLERQKIIRKYTTLFVIEHLTRSALYVSSIDAFTLYVITMWNLGGTSHDVYTFDYQVLYVSYVIK